MSLRFETKGLTCDKCGADFEITGKAQVGQINVGLPGKDNKLYDLCSDCAESMKNTIIEKTEWKMKF